MPERVLEPARCIVEVAALEPDPGEAGRQRQRRRGVPALDVPVEGAAQVAELGRETRLPDLPILSAEPQARVLTECEAPLRVAVEDARGLGRVSQPFPPVLPQCLEL